MGAIVLASGNAGKARELAALLAGLGWEIIPQTAFAVPEAEETGLTFVENALLKARNAAQRTGMPALADDSGLVVDALGGRPGIHSARYAGPGADDQSNIDRLLLELREAPPERRTARFVCVLALLRHAADPLPVLCEGRWEGSILTEPHGANGFGYDPVFLVPGENRTAAELDPAVKNRLSHRGQALARLAERLRGAFGA